MESSASQDVQEPRSKQSAIPKPFPCQMCKKAFVSADRLNHHISRIHNSDSAQLSLRLPKTEPIDEDSDMPVDLSSDGVNKNRTPQPPIDQTPTPTRLLSALEHNGIFASTPFRTILAHDNPFGVAFRNGLSSVKSSNKGDSSPLMSPSEINPILFTTPMSPMTIPVRLPNGEPGGETSGIVVWSPGGPFGLMRSPPVFLPANVGQYLTPPHLAGFTSSLTPLSVPASTTSSGMNMFPGFSTQYYPTIANKSASPKDVDSDSTKSGHLPNDIPSSTTSLQSQPKSEPEFVTPKGDKAVPASDVNQQMRDILKRRVEEYLSENSETQSVVSAESSTPQVRRSRPILETDDPVLADKRRRNRIAAEKCRKRRKDLRDSLERNNKDLELKFKLLSTKFSELRDTSRQAVEELQAENQSLRKENDILRSRIGLPNGISSVKPSLVLLKSVMPDLEPVKSGNKNEST